MTDCTTEADEWRREVRPLETVDHATSRGEVAAGRRAYNGGVVEATEDAVAAVGPAV